MYFLFHFYFARPLSQSRLEKSARKKVGICVIYVTLFFPLFFENQISSVLIYDVTKARRALRRAGVLDSEVLALVVYLVSLSYLASCCGS